MKKTFHYLAFISLILALSFTSCVSGKKFKASQARVDKLERDSTFTHGQLTDCNINVKDLKAEKSNLLNKNASLTDKNASLTDENASVANNLKSLSSESQMTIADQATRLKNLQDIIQSQKDVMLKLKKSISDALINYKADQLSVYIKDGNVYVSLQEKLLFKSGSDIVDPMGKEALKSLVQVLSSAENITVIIEGHTDNIPIKTKLFKDNWDLSTSRASSILRIMTTDYGFDSNRITASGKGQFHPIQTNETTEGRASNRRTEIILSPDLNELYKQLYEN